MSQEKTQLYIKSMRVAHSLVTTFVANIASHIKHGNGLVLYGPAGTGKDHLAIAAMRIASRQHRVYGRYSRGVDLYSDIRKHQTSEFKVDHYIDTPLLVISDPVPPRGSLSDAQADGLYEILDKRYRKRRPTWATINISSSDQLSAILGTAVADRLIDNAVCVPCEWPSYRRPQIKSIDPIQQST